MQRRAGTRMLPLVLHHGRRLAGTRHAACLNSDAGVHSLLLSSLQRQQHQCTGITQPRAGAAMQPAAPADAAAASDRLLVAATPHAGPGRLPRRALWVASSMFSRTRRPLQPILPCTTRKRTRTPAPAAAGCDCSLPAARLRHGCCWTPGSWMPCWCAPPMSGREDGCGVQQACSSLRPAEVRSVVLQYLMQYLMHSCTSFGAAPPDFCCCWLTAFSCTRLHAWRP